MKFLILASLFVLSVVADPEAEAEAIRPLDLTHKTSGFVRYTNGAITPEDTDSVKAAKIQHHTLKAALIDNKKNPVTYAAVNPFHQSQVYGLHHQQQFVAPQVYGLHRQQQFAAHQVAPQNFYGLHRQQQAFAPQIYGAHHQQQFVAPQVAPQNFYGLHRQQQAFAPQVYGAHHQQQVYQPRGIFGMPAVRHLGKRDAEAEPEAEAEAEAEAQYLSSQYYGQYYGTPASTYPLTRGFQGYPYAAASTTGYPSTYNTALTGYPSTYNTAYTGYPNTYNTGYPSIYKAALYNKAQVQARKVVSGPAVQKE